MTTADDERATPTIAITPNPIFQWTVTVKLENYAQGYQVEWGDGTRRSTVGAGKEASHAYPSRPGGWQVQVFAENGTTFVTQKLAVVRGGRLPKGYSITRNPENTAEVWVVFEDTADNTGVLPHFTVEWPKTKDHYSAWGVPSAMLTRLMPYGDHEVIITDTTTGRVATEQVHVAPPDYDPDFVLRRKPGGDAFTVQLEYTKVTEGKKVIIGWGAGTASDVHDSVKVGDKFEHTYPEPPAGESKYYLVQSGYDDESGTPKGVDVTVPLA